MRKNVAGSLYCDDRRCVFYKDGGDCRIPVHQRACYCGLGGYCKENEPDEIEGSD